MSERESSILTCNQKVALYVMGAVATMTLLIGFGLGWIAASLWLR